MQENKIYTANQPNNDFVQQLAPFYLITQEQDRIKRSTETFSVLVPNAVMDAITHFIITDFACVLFVLFACSK